MSEDIGFPAPRHLTRHTFAVACAMLAGRWYLLWVALFYGKAGKAIATDYIIVAFAIDAFAHIWNCCMSAAGGVPLTFLPRLNLIVATY